MNELLGWTIVVGLAVTISAIYMLSVQIEKQTRTTLEILLHSNEMIIARLDGADGSPVQRDTAAALGVAPERRRTERRNPLTRMLAAAGAAEYRGLPQRRLEDLLQG